VASRFPIELIQYRFRAIPIDISQCELAGVLFCGANRLSATSVAGDLPDQFDVCDGISAARGVLELQAPSTKTQALVTCQKATPHHGVKNE
jgi:hypothetical protein